MKQKIEYVLVLLLVIATIAYVLFAPNDMTNADSLGCLLTSQAILQNGSMSLVDYPKLANSENYKYEVLDGQVYYALGFGTSVLCVPAVWVANLLGFDMSTAGDATVQRLVAALIVGGVFLLVWLIARLLLSPVWAIGYAIAVVLGTSFSSTLGTALWNMGFETIGILAAVFIVLRNAVQGKPLRPLFVGLLLGLAFFSRPTASLAVALGGVFVLLSQPRGLIMYAVGVGFWLAVLIAIARISYGLWLPPYYHALGMELTWRPDVVLQGLLISPGRGLFVFSPAILMILAWASVRARKMFMGKLAIGCMIWFCLHVLLMLRFNHWWGGHCYGPRLLTDALPAIVPVGALVVADIGRIARPVKRRLAFGVLVALGVVGIYIHAWHGLYNPETKLWNSRPNIDPNVRYVFDWRFPQPLETQRRRLDRQIDTELPEMGQLPVEEWADVGLSNAARYYGWSQPGGKNGGKHLRWQKGDNAYIAVVLENVPIGSIVCELSLSISENVTVEVSWNGVSLETLGPGDGSFQIYSLVISEELMKGPRHRGTSYPLVPIPLRRGFNSKMAHEIEFELSEETDENVFVEQTPDSLLFGIDRFRWVGNTNVGE